jgi:hypothetical protein
MDVASAVIELSLTALLAFLLFILAQALGTHVLPSLSTAPNETATILALPFAFSFHLLPLF